MGKVCGPLVLEEISFSWVYRSDHERHICLFWCFVCLLVIVWAAGEGGVFLGMWSREGMFYGLVVQRLPEAVKL